MKKVGIIGGTGPEATVDYYRSILAAYQERTGNKEDLPELIINSINMYKIFRLLEEDRHEELVTYLVEAVQSLERAGADFAVLSANTAHIAFDDVQKRVEIPLISIVEATCSIVNELKLEKVGLIGTGFTMKHDFYQKVFSPHGKKIIVPNAEDREYIHERIVNELERGIIKEDTKERFIEIIEKMEAEQGIQGVILGCTELPLMIKPIDLKIPELNTTEIHVIRILEEILSVEASDE